MFDRCTARGGLLAQPRIDLGQRGAAVDLGLALAEQVQVGAVQDQNLHGALIRALLGSPATGCARASAPSRLARCAPARGSGSCPRRAGGTAAGARRTPAAA